MKEDLLSIADLSPGVIRKLLEQARRLKAELKAGRPHEPVAAGRHAVLVFEKPSLRTRVTFEVAVAQLGGRTTCLAPTDVGMGTRETVRDVALNLSRWVDLIVARTFAHKTVADLAQHATIPVINALSDLEHPCQVLADFLTILEHKESFDDLTLAWVGDGNNVCNSLILGATALGINTRVATPKGYEPIASVRDAALNQAKVTNCRLDFYTDPLLGVKNADIIYTDTWASMGQEPEADARREVFRPYQVNQKLLLAARPDVLVMHCLPAHRGEEITDEVMEGRHSIILDQAENRLHAQKAVIAKLLRRS